MARRFKQTPRTVFKRKPGAFDRFICSQVNEKGSKIMDEHPLKEPLQSETKSRLPKFE